MGVYGLRNKRTGAGDGPAINNDQGADEVDNAMSKFARTSSPLPKHRHPNKKRNSFSLVHTDDESNDDDNELAKSVPAYLPSYSHCSDEFRNRNTPEDSQNRTGESVPWPELQLSRNGTRSSDDSVFHHSNSPNLSLHQEQNKMENKKKAQQIFTSVSIIGVASIVAACYYGELLNAVQGTNYTTNNYDQLRFYNDMNNLGKKYKINDDSILRVQSGISTIFQNEDAGSFIFVYNTRRNDFDQTKFDKFMDDIALTAAKYLRNGSASSGHLALDTSKLDMQTHSELMHKYRDDVTKTGVMLVKEIDQVPSILAMAFHYYCDEYNPLVKKSAVFFTLDLARCSNSPDKQLSAHAHIEKCLAMKWNGVPEDKIGPLLTRVVSTVVDITDK